MNRLAAVGNHFRVSGFMLLTILLVGTPAYAQQINRAIGRPATASSSAGAGYTADRAADGSTSTRWSSAFSNSEWWSVDLGVSYSVTKVVINWEAAYATAYDLQISSDGISWTTYFSGTNSFPANSGGASTAITPASVSAIGRYVRLVGKNRAIVWGGQWGYSAWEIQVFGDPPAAPPIAPPTAPNGPTPTAGGSGISINTALSWSAATGATSYNVAFGTSTPPPQAATGLATTSFQPTTALAYSTTYYWRITAVNAAGSTAGPIWSFMTGAAPPAQPPAAPAGPSPAAGGGGVSVNTALNWSAASGATSYNVAFGTSTPPSQAAAGLTTASFQPATTLAYSTTYFWRITAVNAAGSTAGPIWSFTTGAAPPTTHNTVLKRLRVVTWNVAQGYTLAGAHDEDDQIDLIASLNPDVVVLNEVSLADNDMPAYYTSGLQARTSKSWHGRFTQSIAGAPPANAQGTMILTWLPVDDESSDVYCAVPGDSRAPNDTSCAGFVRFAVTVNAVTLQIAGVHLNWYDANYRSLQMNELRTWLASYGPNQLVGGDFNAEPDETALWPNWLTSHRDVWAQATVLTGEPGFTKDKRTVTLKPGRIDYQFIPADPAHIGVQQVAVVHTVLSDHHVLVADYVIQ